MSGLDQVQRKEYYFVVSYSEDGDFSISVYDNKEELIDAFDIAADPDDYTPGCHPADGFKMMLDERTPGHMIIKGNVIKPKAIKVVEEYDLE